jgi:uncharacterized protein (TIGR02246 family)
MKQLSFIIATFGIVIAAQAQTKTDEDAVRAIPRSMCDAWAKHDGHEMAKFVAEDVDFVTVGATWLIADQVTERRVEALKSNGPQA